MLRNTLLLLWLSVLTVSSKSGERESKVVKTINGKVKGYKDTDLGIFSFRNIPYATMPTGSSRYKAPIPPPAWLSTLDEDAKTITCPQIPTAMAMFPHNVSMQEDCLIASVYTPDTNAKKLPVVVYVHGGGFQMGFGDWMVPKKLVSEHDIILVTFNYRLGVHGFLCLGTKDVPGNAGMKDQVALLNWVKKNIANFGGNPDDVTIAGGSAGSASVDLLMLSKAAKGLFTKVIPESGANSAAFTVQSDPMLEAKNFARASDVTFDVDDVYALEEFYKTSSFEQLYVNAFFDRPNSTFGFSPCVERPGTVAFLDESPIDILKSGRYTKVPLLYGFANMEGLIRIDFFNTWKDKMNKKFSDFLPADMMFESESQMEEVANTVKEFYFGDQPITNDGVLAYVDYFTDVLFAYSTLRSTRLHVENGHDQVYLYEFTYVDENTPLVPFTNVRGANHCAQSNAIIEVSVPGYIDHSKSTAEYKKMSSTLRQLWANFIKIGKPVPDSSALPAWGAVRGEWAPHMSLGAELQQRGSLLPRRARFWDQLYDKYYRNPSPPPHTPPRHVEL